MSFPVTFALSMHGGGSDRLTESDEIMALRKDEPSDRRKYHVAGEASAFVTRSPEQRRFADIPPFPRSAVARDMLLSQCDYTKNGVNELFYICTMCSRLTLALLPRLRAPLTSPREPRPVVSVWLRPKTDFPLLNLSGDFETAD